MQEEKRKAQRKKVVNTIWAIDAALVVLVLGIVYLLVQRYVFAMPEESDLASSAFPRDLHFDDFEPLDMDGNIHICENFLSYDEIDILLDLVDESGGWKSSPTGGENFLIPHSNGNTNKNKNKNKNTFQQNVRSSSVVRTIEERIAQATGIPIHPDEDMVHLANIKTHGDTPRHGNYPPFGLHHDTDTRPWRKTTVLVYLTTVLEGGRTIFPLSVPLDKTGIIDVKMGRFQKDLQKQLHNEDQQWQRQVTFPLDSTHPYMDLIEASCHGEIGVTVQPIAGRAIMFHHLVDNDSSMPNVKMWHAGCNVVGNDEEKILLQKFKEKKVHQRDDVTVQLNSHMTHAFNYQSFVEHSEGRHNERRQKSKKMNKVKTKRTTQKKSKMTRTGDGGRQEGL